MKEPAATCPVIDGYITDLQKLADKIQDIARELEGDIKSAFEELRDLNLELRDWGAEGWGRAEELEDEIEALRVNFSVKDFPISAGGHGV